MFRALCMNSESVLGKLRSYQNGWHARSSSTTKLHSMGEKPHPAVTPSSQTTSTYSPFGLLHSANFQAWQGSILPHPVPSHDLWLPYTWPQRLSVTWVQTSRDYGLKNHHCAVFAAMWSISQIDFISVTSWWLTWFWVEIFFWWGLVSFEWICKHKITNIGTQKMHILCRKFHFMM
jgi:hypothetical protein